MPPFQVLRLRFAHAGKSLRHALLIELAFWDKLRGKAATLAPAMLRKMLRSPSWFTAGLPKHQRVLSTPQALWNNTWPRCGTSYVLRTDLGILQQVGRDGGHRHARLVSPHACFA